MRLDTVEMTDRRESSVCLGQVLLRVFVSWLRFATVAHSYWYTELYA